MGRITSEFDAAARIHSSLITHHSLLITHHSLLITITVFRLSPLASNDLFGCVRFI